MTKLMTVFIIVLAIFLGYRIFVYWEKVESEGDIREQEARKVVKGEQLPGLPWDLEESLRIATQRGDKALGTWLARNGARIEDPRRAWIQLDYCELLSRSGPNEARALFAEVWDRTPTNSPVVPRLRRLEGTFR
jgi:hypothetical protein